MTITSMSGDEGELSKWAHLNRSCLDICFQAPGVLFSDLRPDVRGFCIITVQGLLTDRAISVAKHLF
jgi:hypothetical protein